MHQLISIVLIFLYLQVNVNAQADTCDVNPVEYDKSGIGTVFQISVTGRNALDKDGLMDDNGNLNTLVNVFDGEEVVLEFHQPQDVVQFIVAGISMTSITVEFKGVNNNVLYSDSANIGEKFPVLKSFPASAGFYTDVKRIVITTEGSNGKLLFGKVHLCPGTCPLTPSEYAKNGIDSLYTITVTGRDAADKNDLMNNNDNINTLVNVFDGEEVVLEFHQPQDVVQFIVAGKSMTSITVEFKDVNNNILYSNSAAIVENFPVIRRFPEPAGFITDVKKIVITTVNNGKLLLGKVLICKQPEECVCRVRGDPIMEPCDFGIRMLRGEESYDLANYNGTDCSFRVRINTTEIEPRVVIPTDMEIEVPQNGDRYKILRDKELSKNGVEQPNPESFADENISCELSDDGVFLVCSPNNCGARFAFYGVGHMSETLIVLPGEIVDGVTGECNKNEG